MSSLVFDSSAYGPVTSLKAIRPLASIVKREDGLLPKHVHEHHYADRKSGIPTTRR